MNKRQRGRNRNNNRNRQPNNNPNKSLDSNGPDIRVRGSASTIYEKYITLARDARSAGSRVKAENYLQHAEHYLRIVQEQQAKAQILAEEQAKKQDARQQEIRENRAKQDAQNAQQDGNSDNEQPSRSHSRRSNNSNGQEANSNTTQNQADVQDTSGAEPVVEKKTRTRRKKMEKPADAPEDVSPS